MKAIIHEEIGNPTEVLKLVEKEAAPLTEGHVRVSILASPIHPADLLKVMGHYGIQPQLPAVPGHEAVGRITEVGAGVTHLEEGQLVMVVDQGAWQQEVVMSAATLFPLPEVEDINQLSMITINAITAYLMLKTITDLKEGDWVVQNAANSSVGMYLIQLAKQYGIKTVNIVRRESLVQELLDMGADSVLVDGPDLAEQIKEVTGGGAKLALDAVGGESFTKLLEGLAKGGQISVYGAMSMEPPALSSSAMIFNDLTVKGFWLVKWFETATREEMQAAFGEVIGLLAQGVLYTKVGGTYGLDQIQEAVVAALTPGRDGKILLLPNG